MPNVENATRTAQEARHLLTLGRLDEARRRATAALVMEPQNAAHHTLLARIELAADNPDGTIECTRRSLSLELNAEALHLCGVAHRLKRDYQISLDLLNRALMLEPSNPHLHASRSLTLSAPFIGPGARDAASEIGTEALAAADDAAAQALALDPNLRIAPYALALAELARGNHPEAATHGEHALRLSPEWAEAHLLLGQIRQGQGMDRLASQHFATAGQLEPTDDEAIVNLRNLTRDRGVSFTRLLPFALICALVLLPLGWIIFAAGLVGFVALAWIASRVIARRRLAPDTRHLTPEAQRILRADHEFGPRAHSR